MEGITSPPLSQNSSGAFYSPLFLSTLGIVVTSLAIIFYHFFLVKYCMRHHQTTTTAVQPNPTTGVEKKLLDTIPILLFSVLKLTTEQEECVVCLGELEDEDVVRLLPNCKHAFHLSCIDQWFQAHVSCPLCRSLISPQMLSDSNPNSESLRQSTSNSSDMENSAAETYICDDETPSLSLTEVRPLRHCASVVLQRTAERERSARLIAGLKRSLSMDQSFVVIDLQRESMVEGGNENSSSEVTSGSYETRSLNQFDRMSSRLLRSFSRLRLGKTNSSSILPY